MGPTITHATVWAAVLLYGISTCLLLLNRPTRVSRCFWTLGLLVFLAHVCAAFHYFYEWSHEVAFQETARTTEEFTGNRSGFGIYLNYLFTAVWLTDCAWWWIAGDDRYRNRRRWTSLTLHGFFLFMIINGGIVFVTGPVRWFTTVVVLAVIACAWIRLLTNGSHPIAAITGNRP